MLQRKMLEIQNHAKTIKELKEQLKKGTTPQIEGLNLELELIKELKKKFPKDIIEHHWKGAYFYKTIFLLKNMKLKTILIHLLKDRTYFDYWSLVHFGFGILIAFLLKLIRLSLITTVFTVLFLLAFWEIIEPKLFKYILKTEFKENPTNQIMDIIYGFLGFLVYWFWL